MARKRPRADELYPVKSSDLLREEEEITRTYRERAAEDFLCFARGLTIAAQVGPRMFETVMEGFQRKTFEDIAPSLHALRDGEPPRWPRWWIERTKKASKDADLAIILLWVLAFPKRPFYAQVGAGDKQQAAIVKDRLVVLLHYNPWLNDLIEVVQWHVKSKATLVNGSPMATLDIMAGDISGAHGGTPDLLVVNELTHIQKWEFVQNLMDNADGVAQGMVIIATNAGEKGTKAETWRNNAITNKERWSVHILSRPAPWHNQSAIDDAKLREKTPSRFSRLWWGRWVSGKGDALDEEAIDRMFTGIELLRGRKKGYEYVAGLDLGVHHDHSGFVILGVNEIRKRVDLAYARAWEPGPSGVYLPAVEEECLLMCNLFKTRALYYDPSQAILMAQRLERHIHTRPMPFTGKNLNLMAEGFMQLVMHNQMRLFDIDGGRLRRDIGKFHIKEKPYGFRLEAVRDESGHADVGTALLIAIPPAIELLNGTWGLGADEVLVDTNDEELTEDEVAEMPADLRGIYDMSEEDELASLYNRRRDTAADVL